MAPAAAASAKLSTKDPHQIPTRFPEEPINNALVSEHVGDGDILGLRGEKSGYGGKHRDESRSGAIVFVVRVVFIFLA